MAINLNDKLSLLKDSDDGKAFVFADSDETGNGKDFVLSLMPHDQQFFNKAYSKCTTVKFKRGRRDEVLDEQKFDNLMVKFYVRGWDNLTVKTLRKFLAFSTSDSLNDTDLVDFSEENLTYLWNHSLEFRRQVNDIVMDTVQFSGDDSMEKGLDENFTSTPKPKAARGLTIEKFRELAEKGAFAEGQIEEMEKKAIALAPENLALWELFVMIRDQVLSIQLGDKFRLAPSMGVLLEAMKFYGFEEDKRILRRILSAWNFYISNELLKK